MTRLRRCGTQLRRRGTRPGFIGELVDELVELGYVRREPDPTDRRAKLIVPTTLGLDEMSRADTIMADIERRHAQAIGERAYADFKRSFQQVAQRQRAAVSESAAG